MASSLTRGAEAPRAKFVLSMTRKEEKEDRKSTENRADKQRGGLPGTGRKLARHL